MIRGTTILWGILVLLVSTAMFLMKMQVQTLEDSLAKINRATRQDREAIRVLEAEWAYLNTPVRLSEQSRRLLAMEPLDAETIVALSALPLRGKTGTAMARNAAPGSSTPAAAKPRGRAAAADPQAELASLEGDQ
ncbi:cell division protein FtsL [Novispirillum itersonii]|uniref:cell division protein FtsL n=1 Tax=Novispirillum itersonii TaxID=189 RepID=UPI0003668399|nr:hypothetical protein [Novispirillum itersonii]